MGVKIKASGKYALYEDAHRHRFLVLDGRRWYVWIEGQQSPIIVRTDADHDIRRTVQQGKYFLVDFNDDPNFRDMPHLFLQKGERYREFLLPNGLPTGRDPQKRLVVTRKTLSKDELGTYLKPVTRATRRSRVRQAAA
jgi:hypothetical protein